MNQPLSDHPVPLRIASPEAFERAARFLRGVPYDEATICAALSIDGIGGLRSLNWAAAPVQNLSPALRWCLDLFVRGLSSTASDALAICGEPAFAALCALGLLRSVPGAPDHVESPVALHPVDGFLVASDRHEDTFADHPPPDLVFPADDLGTLKLLRLMPAASGGESLDLGGGSGIGALHMSRTARRATTSDVTARAARFAAFNAALSGASIAIAQGDLYASVAGSRFDLITFHPPFLPRIENARVFSVGGDTGEELTRRAVEGLPEVLRPGGLSLILCAGQERGDAAFEVRAREWLASSAESFDIVFAQEWTLPVEGAIAAFRQRARLTGDEALALERRLGAAGTRQFAYGALVLRRKEEAEAPIADPPLRIGLAADTGAADLERILAWRRRRREPGFAAWLATARPRLAPGVDVTLDEVVENNAVVARYTFAVSSHVRAALRPDPFVVPLLRRLDGTTSVARAFARASRDLPAGFSLAPFTSLVALMIERGLMIL